LISFTGNAIKIKAAPGNKSHLLKPEKLSRH